MFRTFRIFIVNEGKDGTCPFYRGKEGVVAHTRAKFTFRLLLIVWSLPVCMLLRDVAVVFTRAVLGSILVSFLLFCFKNFSINTGILAGTGRGVRRRSLEPVVTHPKRVTLKYEDTEGLKVNVTIGRMLR